MLTLSIWRGVLTKYIESEVQPEAEMARTLLGLVEIGEHLGVVEISDYMDKRAAWLLDQAEERS